MHEERSEVECKVCSASPPCVVPNENVRHDRINKPLRIKSNSGWKPIHDSRQLVYVCLAWSIDTVSDTACCPPGVLEQDDVERPAGCVRACFVSYRETQLDLPGQGCQPTSQPARQPASRLPSLLHCSSPPSLLRASL